MEQFTVLAVVGTTSMVQHNKKLIVARDSQRVNRKTEIEERYKRCRA